MVSAAPGSPDRPDRSSRESGHTLLVALLAVLVLGAALALVAASLGSRMRGVQTDVRGTALLALSDAALARTLAEMAVLPSVQGIPEQPFGGGTIESEVSREGGRRFLIAARATFGGAEIRIEARGIHPADQPPRVTSWRRLPAGQRSGTGGGFTRPDL